VTNLILWNKNIIWFRNPIFGSKVGKGLESKP